MRHHSPAYLTTEQFDVYTMILWWNMRLIWLQMKHFLLMSPLYMLLTIIWIRQNPLSIEKLLNSTRWKFTQNSYMDLQVWLLWSWSFWRCIFRRHHWNLEKRCPVHVRRTCWRSSGKASMTFQMLSKHWRELW